ncbi:ABC transporter ATP-binding protein [Cellvibrio sp. NN19]|uniref:ABC transporter ATP-binding protein n=1 Tax=Cellvibrio chitinivorans TaxID=3102792 RepID=UPI002B40FAEF|nr:ABC transporter ATP-binding protein [Cellvibrio sp. NN19]
MYILNIIKNIYSVLSKEQRKKMLLLQIFFAFSGIVQVVGVASIAPFIGLISNPQAIETNQFFSYLYNYGKFTDHQSFIVGFALLSMLMILVANTVNAFTLWVQLRFSVYIGGNIQLRLYDTFIRRDYLFHKMHNYNKVISIISSEAPRFIYMVLQQYLNLCSQLFVAAIILIGLIILDPFIAMGSAVLIGLAYITTYAIIKKSLKHHGDVVTHRNKLIQKILSESFIGIKDIKLNSLEHKYTTEFHKINKTGLESNTYIALSGDLPRFAIETISFCAILLFALMLLNDKGNNASVVSILSIYALAGYKLLPTMQQVYKSISVISANGAVVNELSNQLSVSNKQKPTIPAQSIPSIEAISLHQVSYQYPNTEKLALQNISIRFERGTLNTIAGPSGSGKSTLADVILGLLHPATGELKIDGNLITNNTELEEAYQASIGYVPQHIFILDDNVIANVAFGIAEKDVDLAQVTKALEQANALDFVSKLPNGIHTSLGQDGKLLSGGQRQRIGIARALYRDNQVLVLDEPTSALDIHSEHELMNLLNQLKQNVLTIVISHRPAAIKLSDNITLITDGQVEAHGSYSQLHSENEHFRTMIEKGLMNHDQ